MSTVESSKLPRYLQLADQLRHQVQAGHLKPGDRLPSFATMKAAHGVSQNTWDKAHALLEKERIVVRLPNKGTFVAEPARHAQVGVIGVAMAKAPWQHPYYSQLLKGIHKGAHQAGLEVLLLGLDAVIAWEKVDGVLVLGKAGPVLEKLPPDMPSVSLLHDFQTRESVVSDDAQGMQEAVEHLLALGHQRIGYLADAVLGSAAASNVRLVTYRNSLQSAGITFDKSWVRSLHDPKSPVRQPFSVLGRLRMTQWLQEGWTATGCTALLTQNDETAIGAIEALQDAGIDVPGQVSVIGFDGTEIAQFYRPRLTTINVPLEAIGATGVKRLLEQINGRHSGATAGRPGGSTIMPTRLMVGESAAFAPTVMSTTPRKK